jgi:hypothetical protein
VVEISDERLIDHALGLEDDPELEQELARSGELRERLQLLEADLRQIDTELHGVLPAVEEGWADLSHERWRRLQPFLEPPATRRSRSLRSRLLVPALALLVVAALLVGVFSLRDVGPQSSQTSAGGAARAPEAAGIPSALQKAVGGLAGGYRQVVVAQAGAVQNGRQPYEVVRVLKGPALTSLTVDLGSATGVPEGSLQVVYLDPLSSPPAKAQDGQATLGNGGTTGATPASSGQNGDFGAGGQPTVASPQAVTIDGKPALVQPLPSGVDPSTLSLP